jgi:hypothetical protein
MSAQLKINELDQVQAELSVINSRRRELEQKKSELNGEMAERVSKHSKFMESELDISIFRIFKALGGIVLDTVTFKR